MPSSKGNKSKKMKKDEYEVEKILGDKERKNSKGEVVTMYRIKWKGYFTWVVYVYSREITSVSMTFVMLISKVYIYFRLCRLKGYCIVSAIF